MIELLSITMVVMDSLLNFCQLLISLMFKSFALFLSAKFVKFPISTLRMTPKEAKRKRLKEKHRIHLYMVLKKEAFQRKPQCFYRSYVI